MKEKIGSYYYLFKKANTNPTFFVISSHGGVMARANSFRTLVNLNFLKNEGESVALGLDTAIANFAPGNTTHQESAGTTVNDYVLGKFQGRHSEHKGKLSHLWGKLTGSNDYEETYNNIEAVVGQYDNLGVVTVRNRKGFRAGHEATLSEISGILRQRFNAEKILCLFCRVHTVYEWVRVMP